jgi:hypothetical protein
MLCQLQPNSKKWITRLEREFEIVFNPIYFHPFPIGKHYSILSRLIVDISKVVVGMSKWYFQWHIDKNSLSLSHTAQHQHTMHLCWQHETHNLLPWVESAIWVPEVDGTMGASFVPISKYNFSPKCTHLVTVKKCFDSVLVNLCKYCSTLASSRLIILYSEMLKFQKMFLFKNQSFVKEIKECLKIFWIF